MGAKIEFEDTELEGLKIVHPFVLALCFVLSC